MKTLNLLVDATLAIEKLRINSQVRQSHLALDGRADPETDELHRRIKELEDYVDGRIATLLKSHPAYPWFSRVKGVGKENIGKIVGLVDIAKAPTISSLWKFAGYAPVNGHAEKRTKGEKLAYCAQLRTMCWRLGSSLMKANGKFKGFYDDAKLEYVAKMLDQGRAIVPAAKLPSVKGEDGKRKKTETAECISEGHIHNMALRKMIKCFLACLFIAWRSAEGLPVPEPYAIGILGHSHKYSPEDFMDR